MILVKQKSPTQCGQCCVAMLLGISRSDAIALVGHDRTTHSYELIRALNKAGAALDEKKVQRPPVTSMTALQRHQEPEGVRAHWTVLHEGELYDPASIGDKMWPVHSWIPIDLTRLPSNGG